MLIEKMLVPVDFSEHSRRALDYAGALAELVGQPQLEVLHVAPRAVEYLPLDRSIWGADKDEHAIDEQIRRAAEQGFDEFMASCPTDLRGRVSTRIDAGPAHERILATLAEGGHDLVVIGTHGRSGVRHLLLGSVAERVVREAEIPVLTVR